MTFDDRVVVLVHQINFLRFCSLRPIANVIHLRDPRMLDYKPKLTAPNSLLESSLVI